jgi:hypothetical protein
VAAAIALCLALAQAPAAAQYSTLGDSVSGKAGLLQSNYAFGLYPLTVFAAPHSSQADFVVAADAAWRVGPTGSSIGIGSFYVSHGSQDLLEIHANGFINKNWGLQVGYLTAVQNSGTAWDMYLVYRTGIVGSHATIEVGAGGFADETARGSTGFTGYVHASVPIVKSVSADAVYWYVDDYGNSIHRISVGASYHF